MRSNQKTARKCYEDSLKTKRGVCAVTTGPPRDKEDIRIEIAPDRRAEPVEEVVEREVGGKPFKLGKSLSQEM